MKSDARIRWGFFILETMEKNDKGIEKYLKIVNEILYNPELDCTEKILLAEIQSLHKLEKGCFASNEHFALLLSLKTPSAASRRISKLTEMGYITTKYNFGRGNSTVRIITPTFKKAPDLSDETVFDHSKGSSDRNQVVPERHEGGSDVTGEVVPEEQGGSSDVIGEVVPDEQGGSSDSTGGVVPTEQGGSSVGNTINTIKETDLNNPLYDQPTRGNEIENLFDIKESTSQQTPKPEAEAIEEENIFPSEFYAVLDKYIIQGWNSLSVKEASIFWHYNDRFNKFIRDHPERSDYKII